MSHPRSPHEVPPRSHQDRLIEQHLGLARSLAARYRSRGVEFQDLEQVACLGLVGAARRYRSERGEFGVFAAMTIEGELKKYFRDHAWVIRPPRRIQQLRSELATSYRDRLTDAEQQVLACRHGVTRREVGEALAATTCFRADSLDVPARDGRAPRSASICDGVDGDHAGLEDLLDLRRVLAALSARERTLIRLRFFDELTQQQIAERLGISQIQVSRRLTRVLARLRATLEAGPQFASADQGTAGHVKRTFPPQAA
ncbi:sigma-70 family RNA polymerase sigma factor [Pseudactinotalea sp. HY160]|nr:sigma-70 family RNA polymerase sigma factor [Pseudactinotalea sp. HY160]